MAPAGRGRTITTATIVQMPVRAMNEGINVRII
jgi:hypothetical protein